MIIRSLNINDYYKNYIDLLQQLTSVGNISFQEFSNQFNNMSNNHFIYVIENNNKIIASGTLLIEYKFIHQCSKVGHIEDIVIDKNYRGQGLGKKIIEYLIDEASKNNCYKIILNCDMNNKEFYEKIGFKEKNIQMAIYFE